MVCLIVGVWFLGIQQSNAQLPIRGINAVQDLVTKLDQTIDSFNGRVNEYQQKINAYETKVNEYDQKVNTTINQLEGKIQSQIDGISGQVQNEIEGIRNTIDSSIKSIETRVVSALGTLSWGLLLGDSVVSALFSGLATWWVTRRLRRTVKAQLDELNETFKQGVNHVATRTEEATQAVTEGVSQTNMFAMMQGLQAENQRIIQLLSELRKP